MPRKKKTEEKEEKETKEELKEESEEKPVKKTKEKESETDKTKTAAKEKKEDETLLVPLEDYIRVSIHIGTRAVTPTMREYVYRRKADGIAVLNTKKIDEKIGQAASFLARYAPEDIIVCGKKDAASKPLEAFNDATGIRIFKKYPAGIITNSKLKTFFEPKLIFILDPWVDKNALNDAVKIRIPVISLCSTNNNTHNIDFVIPCNNKTQNSIGLVLYLIAKLYLEKKGMKDQLRELRSYPFYSTDTDIRLKAIPRERIDMTAARELIKKKLAEKKAKEHPEEKVEEKPAAEKIEVEDVKVEEPEEETEVDARKVE
ncbi:MAG: 30S ribosomal protein S2 [Candidatus Pacearchaeota archaeon]|nr:30S ribosomal protein S2 [Candidatus Pacearchaeota archaeon]